MIQFEPPELPYRRMVLGISVALGLIILFALLNLGKTIYTETIWFQSVGFQGVYKTIILTRLWMFLAGTGIFAVVFAANVYLARRLARQDEPSLLPPESIVLIHSLTRLGVVVATVMFAFIFGAIASGQWETLLRFMHANTFLDPTGAPVVDPLHGRNPSFYVFTLPLWRFAQQWITGLIGMLFLGSVGVYAASYILRGFRIDFAPGVKVHLLVLGIALALAVASSYWFDIQELVLSSTGLDGNLFGASATDVNAGLIALKIMIVVTLLVGVVCIFGMFRPGFVFPLGAFGVWLALAIIVLTVFPAAYQRLSVQPNELGKETPYIQRNIAMTRQAYDLTNISVEAFPVADVLPAADAVTNPDLVNNIRIWDHRPLRDTLNQIQFFRPYYTFLDVDVDRYEIDGQVRQVMLSAREMTPEQLPPEAQTWVARRLQYTHGYGVAMSPVNEFTAEGRPTFFLGDLPPTGVFPITRPEIYFGEKTDWYVIVNSATEEFDFPNETGVPSYTRYAGGGGVGINSWLRKAAFAWRFADFNLLISDQVNPESRLLFYRQIQGRIHNIAPFLELDPDPYVVVADGKLWWMQDAFTSTNRYPYSQPFEGRLNYIRNSVKVVVDAYEGTVNFYVVDPADALLETYTQIFPGVFKPLSEMPASIRAHIRYPEHLFNIQEQMFRTYHVTDPRVFFQREDIWSRPQEIVGERTAIMESYYVNLALPGQTEPEFLLLVPFTPFNKPNLVAWMAARNDGEHYGELVAFTFRARQVDGPAQVEARIDNDPTISQQFSLWGQQGSRIIRGNLLVIPVPGSVLYVEPVYLQAATLNFPELKRVIVAIGTGKPAMEPDLRMALQVALGQRLPTPIGGSHSPIVTPTPTPGPGGTRESGEKSTPTEGGVDFEELIQEIEALLDQLRKLEQQQLK